MQKIPKATPTLTCIPTFLTSPFSPYKFFHSFSLLCTLFISLLLLEYKGKLQHSLTTKPTNHMAPQHHLILLLLLSCYTLTTVIAQDTTGFVRSIDREMLEKKENVSQFRFYWQDIVGGDNATSIPIIPPLPKFNSTASAFGLVRIIDNALTLGPQLSSKLVGRAQGFYASASQTELDLLMVMNFVLFEGAYNGSTITILGRNVALNKVREMPVIGGSGVFRFAKGYAEASTYSFDPKSGDTTVEYNVYVSHYT